MSALACKLKSKLSSKIEDLYNREFYLIESCEKFKSKYSLEEELLDLQLRIHFEENNKIVILGKLVDYCQDNVKRKIKLKDISSELNQPEVNIVNNYLVDDKWKKTDW